MWPVLLKTADKDIQGYVFDVVWLYFITNQTISFTRGLSSW